MSPTGWQGSTRKARLPENWSYLRGLVLDRDGGRCTEPGCGWPATDVDHIVPGDDHSLGNLRSLCAGHHRRKSSSEGGRARAARGRRAVEPHPGLIR